MMATENQAGAPKITVLYEDGDRPPPDEPPNEDDASGMKGADK